MLCRENFLRAPHILESKKLKVVVCKTKVTPHVSQLFVLSDVTGISVDLQLDHGSF